MNSCCKECHEQGNSYLGCHGKCEKYKMEQKENKRILKQRINDNILDDTVKTLYYIRKHTKQYKPK